MRKTRRPVVRGSTDVGMGETMRCLQIGFPPASWFGVSLAVRLSAIVTVPVKEKDVPS